MELFLHHHLRLDCVVLSKAPETIVLSPYLNNNNKKKKNNNNEVLRKIYVPEMFRAFEQFKILYRSNRELRNLFRPSKTVRIVESKRQLWTGHIARLGETRSAHIQFYGNLNIAISYKTETEMGGFYGRLGSGWQWLRVVFSLFNRVLWY
jgi:hypothetical protein